MKTVAPPPMTRVEAQVALVRQMLTEHGRTRADWLAIVDDWPYRIHIEAVPADEVPESARQFLDKEPRHDPATE
ncbi:hypothetical protein HPA02_34890 [Bisbaumannia pacifica]|uniref:Uncharacterized protein n=1 Tax=Bisbaumannia pacifica TaxID=77098 RepID=A0A510XCQ3_9GAMM|nr:hypothetical protein [Halomonas pacifica]GEK49206.1 hypothetical protein HPA02_34890 [Halomonas pacifica]